MRRVIRVARRRGLGWRRWSRLARMVAGRWRTAAQLFDACNVVWQQRVLPRCARLFAVEKRHLVVLVQVTLPARWHWICQGFARHINQRWLCLRVNAKISCISKDDAPAQH